jgi:hypothetical protein
MAVATAIAITVTLAFLGLPWFYRVSLAGSA